MAVAAPGRTSRRRRPNGEDEAYARGSHVSKRGIVLPQPPSDDEKYSYLERYLPYLRASVIVGFASLIISQARMEMISARLWPFAVITVMGAVYAVIAVPVNFTGTDFSIGGHRRVITAWRPRRYPSVDIYLPICGEPVEVLLNTWRGVAALAAAYPGRAQVYVLDDGNDPAAAVVAVGHAFTYIVRDDLGWMRKAGNLRNAFRLTRGEFILIFDADFIPRRDFLAETLPYFDDPRVGIVQTPQFFRSDMRQTWVERAANALQEVFYRNIQVARDRLGAVVCCGSCAVYRRAALAPDGGFAKMPYAEDGHTGLNVRRNGYTVKYVPVALSAGISPSDLDTFVRQQYRWCSGTLSLIFKRKLWDAPIPWQGKVAYVSGWYYYAYTALMLFARPLFPVVMLGFYPGYIRPWNYLWLAPAVLAGTLLYPAWHRIRFGPEVWPVVIACGWAHALALWDYARGKTMTWRPTGGGKSPLRRFWVGFICWNCTTAAVWVGLAVWRTAEYKSDRFWVVGLTGAFYIACIVRILIPSRRATR
jgi:Glycosyltransferase like family 2